MEDAAADSTAPGPDAKASAEDVFMTPENSDYYSKIRYHPLDAIRQEIRLLRVLPDRGSALIECELLHPGPLAHVTDRYCALSYCAGSALTTGAILVDGVRCNVFANLAHALEMIRYLWSRHREGELLMWVDQICIDQPDIKERSHQVGFMRSIYESANEVFVCLSTSGTRDLGMDWLAEMFQHIPYKGAEWPQPTRWLSEYAYYETLLLRKPTDNSWPLMDYIWNNITSDTFANGLTAFFDILLRPWWARAWVFQEFMSAKQATFVSGHACVAWNHLHRVLQSFPVTDMSLVAATTGLGQTPHTDTDHTLVKRRLLGILSIVGPRKTELRRNMQMLDRKRNWHGSADLKELRRHARTCHASDERDRVYAFLGLASQKTGIVPDYATENTLACTFIETTRKIILCEDRLDVLAYAEPGGGPKLPRTNMPSWAVDWLLPPRYSRKGSYSDDEIPDFALDDGTRANAVIHSTLAGIALEVSGILLHELTTPPWEGENPKYASFWIPAGPGHPALEDDFHVRCLRELGVSLVDQLWVLLGSSAVFILRPVGNQFSIVGMMEKFTTEIGWKSLLKGDYYEAGVHDSPLRRIMII